MSAEGVTLTIRRDTGRDGGDAVLETRRRWLRIGLYYGVPPGSHIGFWRTRTGPTAEHVHGWNLRIGRRYAGPTLTLLVHTRLVRSGLEAEK